MAHKVLVVDDEVQFCKMVRTFLEHEGYETTVAHDGLEALRLAEEDNPDLVLLDVMIPKVDGFDTLRRLKSNPITERIGVILLTLKDDGASMMEGWESGADAYVTKEPFRREELMSFVKRVLAGKEEENYVAGLLN